MRARFTWDELLPLNETRLATEYLVATWRKLSATRGDKFCYSMHEPKLTEKLHRELADYLAGPRKLKGFWVSESQDVYFNAAYDAVGRNKKDLIYCSNKGKHRLILVFEFKKLGSRATYRGRGGMARFVDGNYALGQPLAVMVGILCDDSMADGMIESLRRSLLQKAIQSGLSMVADADGHRVRMPSVVLAGSAKFDTEHRRPQGKGNSLTNTTTLAHIFLRCGA